jgi:DNA-binding protein H-NS
MKTKLNEYSLKQLIELRDRAIALIDRKVVAERQRIEARLAGLSGTNVVSIRRRRRLGPVARVYRNPDDPVQTWAGRGLRPRWLVAKLRRRGAKIEDFRIAS